MTCAELDTQISKALASLPKSPSRARSRHSILLAALMALVPVVVQAQDQAPPELPKKRSWITIPMTTQSGMAGSLAQNFWRILQNDLATTGPFKITQQKVNTEIPIESDLVLATQLVRGLMNPFMILVRVQDPRTHKELYQRFYKGSPALILRMAHRIADDYTEKDTGVRGAAESQLVFEQETRKGVKEIFKVGLDGKELTQLTHHQSLSTSPTLARDGRLAYITYKGGPPEIWGQRQPSGPQVKLFPTGAENPGILLSPAWSPIGNKLAFVMSTQHGRCDVMLLDLDRNRVDQLTTTGRLNTEPSWDPTGTRLAFTSDREGTSQIYVMQADGTSQQRVTSSPTPSSTPLWSPDGMRIAYISQSGARSDVYVFDLKTGSHAQVTRGGGRSLWPSWSPDGRWIAFTRSISGNSQLMVSDLLGRFTRPLEFMAQAGTLQWCQSH